MADIDADLILKLQFAVLAVLFTGLFSLVIKIKMFGRKNLDVKGKFCYITGGSQGLGKALAADLVRRGAHVVIVARNAKRNEDAVTEFKAIAADPERKIFAVSADLTDEAKSVAALKEACAAFGGNAPDYTFLCAGFAAPRLWLEATGEDLKSNFDGVYWVHAWTAHAVTKLMVRQKRTGTVVFTSSFLGLLTFAGYSPYSPGKFALRGLADTLRSELVLYGIKVHLYLPAGILSPGYDNEQKIKPEITKEIEEDDTPIAPEKAAAYLIKGIEKGNYQITNDLITDLVRCTSVGPVPGNGPMDVVYGFIGSLALPIWRLMTDAKIGRAQDSIYKRHEANGFWKDVPDM